MKLSELAGVLIEQGNVQEKIYTEVMNLKESLTDVPIPADAEAALNRLIALQQRTDELNEDAVEGIN